MHRSPSLDVMSDKSEDLDLKPDPIYELAVQNQFDLLDFCIEQLESEGMEQGWEADDEELQVRQD